MSQDPIKRMVDRFLQWPLPDDFQPDGGIRFTPFGNVGTAHEYRHRPVGTNLFTAVQAEEMIRYILEGLQDDHVVHPAAQEVNQAIFDRKMAIDNNQQAILDLQKQIDRLNQQLHEIGRHDLNERKSDHYARGS